MTYEEVAAMVAETGIPNAYDHFAEGEAVDPPFICFLFPQGNEFGADNEVYFSSSSLDIELYTDAKDPELEKQVEAVLKKHEIYYHKSEVWIESEQLYEVLYEMEVCVEDGEDTNDGAADGTTE